MKKILLVLLFAFFLFAGESEEIGTPVIDWKKAQIESAVLSPDAKSFYTLQETDFIQWNLSPLKKLNEWQVPLKKIITGEEQNRFHDIWFLDNHTKVLITSIEGMMIYNLKTHTVDKQVEYVNHSLVKDGNFIYLTHPRLLKEHIYNIDLEVWSIPELKRVKSVNITEMGREHIDVCCGPEDINSVKPCNTNCAITRLDNLVVGTNVIYYPAHFDHLMILNKSTLEFKELGEYNYSTFEILKGGYLNTGSAIYRLSDDKQINYKGRGWGYKEDYGLKVVQNLLGNRKPARYSGFNDLFLIKVNAYYFKNMKEGIFLGYISQYEGELVIKKNVRSPFFETTSKDTKLLQMYNKEKQIVPMNNATYNTYHTNFNIGEN